MASTNALSEKDVNTPISAQNNDNNAKSDVKSMEYHRQVLASKMEQEKKQQYISPSDGIMSPCTAKLNAMKSRQVSKAKPKSLFAQASAKKIDGENVLGAKSASQSPSWRSDI